MIFLLNIVPLQNNKNKNIMRKFLVVILFFILCVISNAQVTYSPIVGSKNNIASIEKIELTDNETIVTIKYPRQKRGSWVRFSSATAIIPHDVLDINAARKMHLEIPNVLPPAGYEQIYAQAVSRVKRDRAALDELGMLIRHLGPDRLNTQYRVDEKKRDAYYFELHFDRLPYGVEDFYIRELIEDGFEWCHIKIKNPFPKVPNLGLLEGDIKQKINQTNDGVVGIYESTASEDNRYTLACILDNGIYKLVYMNSREHLPQWKISDVKAVLQPSATSGLFRADWYMADKTINEDCYVTFEGATMSVVLSGDKSVYIKMYPTASSGIGQVENTSWTGTGFALKKGFIVTNYHVVENAKNVEVQGVNGSFVDSYNAEIISTDKFNDLALIKITDDKFSQFDPIPYNVKTGVSDVGEEVFVLGYPMTSTMGDEIKLTTGVVSSRTGFQGDMSLYQISAPIQPGNSGGPLFDNNGNIIGVVNAKHKGAENVGYAIKTSYLRNLVESSVSTDILPTNNQISNLPLTQKVKKVKDHIFIIKCSSK